MSAPRLRIAHAIPEWQDRANCHGTSTNAFYPEKRESAWTAKQICRGCDVRAECLQWALDRNEQHGVWGGKTEKERRAMRKQRQVAA